MSKREAIARYNLIIKKLRKQPSSFSEISDYLNDESYWQDYNFNISIRTFQRDLEDIRSLYSIEIKYNFKNRVYYIENEAESEVSERALEAFDIFNALNIVDGLSEFIDFEKRRPQGTDNLYGLIHAIKNRFQISFTHQKYWESESTERTVEPYALKEFKNRWYVLANDLKDNKVKSFALDRLTDLSVSKKKFHYPNDFNINEYYKHCFGIISPKEHIPQEVILSFTPYQGKYIKSLPLHESQQILIDNEEELRIKLTLFVTYDFFMELLSYGANVKVIEPENLISDIKKSLKATLKQY